jgi:hypothetical protein
MPPPGGLEVYAFDWKPGMQYWRTCEYGAFANQYHQEGCEKAVAVFVNWGIPEITRHIRQIFAVYETKLVVVKEIRENVYSWAANRLDATPARTNFDITLGSKTFKLSLEDGSENTMGDLLSRGIGYIIQRFKQCDIQGHKIIHPKDPIPRWPAAPAPTVREMEHAFVFKVSEKRSTSRIIIIYLLGLAPAGFSTAPDNGPWAMAEVVHVGTPLLRSG